MNEHIVQFYENDDFLIQGLSDYIGSALSAGNKGIVIATKTHRQALEDILWQQGLLTHEAPDLNGKYIALEANDMLPLFMFNGVPDEDLFSRTIGGVIKRAGIGHKGEVHVFGEMVAILCGEESNRLNSHGKHDAALHVENCFNMLQKRMPFSLLCGYPMSAFAWAEDAKAFHSVCLLHSSVIPAESYNVSASIDDLQRTIATLQQKACSLNSEVNERRQIEQVLRELNFDRLTGLPNRSVFQDRLDLEIKKSQRARLPLALLFIDLDYFKEINDTLGHDVGDQLLRQVGQRLLLCVRQSDTVARLGGDEFTVILGQLEDVGSVTNVAQNILMKLAEPFKLGNDIAYISASIGITVYPKDATTVGDLLKNADQAMYNSKEMGRNRLSYFTRSMQEVAQMRMALTNEMRVALASNQFCAVYQPIVDLNTGVIHKAEALLRWQHPTRGLIYPAEFIPIAEHTGMIIGLGDWIFYDAVRQALRWRKSDPDFQVSVNVSPVQFHRDGNNYVRWFDYLKKSRLPEKNICAEISVEITEGVLLDASTSILNQLLSFRDAGIQVSLDDFGTGYSSLAYLRKFDIDYLKIDQSFVTNLEENDDNLALCEAIIVMAHKLNLKVIAEGVETATQRDLLRQAGCDYAQGYLFSVPLNAKDFDDLLRQGAISDAQHR